MSQVTRKFPLLYSGFTLIELVIVITIVGLMLFIGLQSTSTVQYWRQQAAIREITESFRFLFQQAMADQSYYRIEFDLKTNSYTIGVVRGEPEDDERFQDIASDAGRISLELTAFLNPSVGETHTIIPPPDYPSLGEPKQLPEGLIIEKIYTPQGWHSRPQSEKVYVHFAPRGFAEFTVLHLRQAKTRELTLVNNPFTGSITIQEGFRDYKWTYGRESKRQ